MLLFVFAPIAYLVVVAPIAVGIGRLLKRASDQLSCDPIYDMDSHEFQQELQRRYEAAGF